MKALTVAPNGDLLIVGATASDRTALKPTVAVDADQRVHSGVLRSRFS